MTFIALDDEPIALAIIQKYAQDVPEAQLLATFLQKNTVDLLISDINMPDVNGLQFVRDLPDERPMVIFATAYKKYAHEGFDLNVVDYLVKPVAPERFQKALQKAADLLDLRRRAEANHLPLPEGDHFFVFSGYVRVKITISDILYLESMGDYIKIHRANHDKPVVTLDRLKNFTAQLEPHGFRRVHRSYLVNLSKIEAKQKSKVLVGGAWIPIGEVFQG